MKREKRLRASSLFALRCAPTPLYFTVDSIKALALTRGCPNVDYSPALPGLPLTSLDVVENARSPRAFTLSNVQAPEADARHSAVRRGEGEA